MEGLDRRELRGDVGGGDKEADSLLVDAPPIATAVLVLVLARLTLLLLSSPSMLDPCCVYSCVCVRSYGSVRRVHVNGGT